MEIKDPNESPEDHKLELLIAEMELEIGVWLCGARNARSDYKLKEPTMTDEELKERLRYTIDHGMFRAVEAGMSCSFSEILNRIVELEAENARFKEALEEIAEEHAILDSDGLYEPAPAYDQHVMWLRAREALKGTHDE